MPTKTAGRDYNELLPGFVTSQTQINPDPGNMQQSITIQPEHIPLRWGAGRLDTH